MPDASICTSTEKHCLENGDIVQNVHSFLIISDLQNFVTALVFCLTSPSFVVILLV